VHAGRGREGTLRAALAALVLLVPIAGAGPVHAQGAALPRDAGQVDVRGEYGAVCDGKADDTAALQRAFREARSNRRPGKRIIQLPAGTCLVRDQLAWRESLESGGAWQQNLELTGAGRDRTTLRLIDGAPGFQDPAKPRAVLYTASKVEPSDPPARQEDGSGNRAFHNHVSNLTIDVGRGNPGAIGIDFLTSNVGALRDLRILAPARTGHSGIRLERYAPGPCLLSRISIEGFDHAIRVANLDYGITLEHVTIAGQKVAGILNSNNVLSMRRLTSDNAVPAISNDGRDGLVVLLDSDLRGGAPTEPAIRGPGKLVLRDVRASGYARLSPGVSELTVSEHVSETPRSAFEGDPRQTLRLPVEDTPAEFVPAAEDQWASVAAYGAAPWDPLDDTLAFESALRSGKPAIYAPTGAYQISRPLQIPASVRLIHFAGSFIEPMPGSYADPALGRDVFVIQESSAQALTLRRFWGAGFAGANVLHHAANRVVIVKDGGFGSVGRIKIDSDTGKVFLEDVSAGAIEIGDRARVWARQLNLEPRSPVLTEMSSNRGGVLWVLGLKTEVARTVGRITRGGCTEVLGGLLYPVDLVPPALPMWIINDGSASLSYAETAYALERSHTVHAEETRQGVTRAVLRGQLPLRGLGRSAPLLSARLGPCTVGGGS
jgi:hypothetical protein